MNSNKRDTGVDVHSNEIKSGIQVVRCILEISDADVFKSQ